MSCNLFCEKCNRRISKIFRVEADFHDTYSVPLKESIALCHALFAKTIRVKTRFPISNKSGPRAFLLVACEVRGARGRTCSISFLHPSTGLLSSHFIRASVHALLFQNDALGRRQSPACRRQHKKPAEGRLPVAHLPRGRLTGARLPLETLETAGSTVSWSAADQIRPGGVCHTHCMVPRVGAEQRCSTLVWSWVQEGHVVG